MVPPPCGAPVGLITWPWILPVGATLAGAGVWAIAGSTAMASNPIQREIGRFMVLSLGAGALDTKIVLYMSHIDEYESLIKLDAHAPIRRRKRRSGHSIDNLTKCC